MSVFADHVALAPSTLRVLADMSRRRHAILAAPLPVLYPDGTIQLGSPLPHGLGLYGDNNGTVDMVDSDNDVTAGWFNADGVNAEDRPDNELTGLHVMTASEAAVSMTFPTDDAWNYSEEFLAAMGDDDTIRALCEVVIVHCQGSTVQDLCDKGLLPMEGTPFEFSGVPVCAEILLRNVNQLWGEWLAYPTEEDCDAYITDDGEVRFIENA